MKKDYEQPDLLLQRLQLLEMLTTSNDDDLDNDLEWGDLDGGSGDTSGDNELEWGDL